MDIKSPTTTTGVTAEYPNSSPLTFITHTPEQEGSVTPPYISPTNMALILLWTALIIMFAILWYHVTFSVSRISTRWLRRTFQDRVSREEASLLEIARSLEQRGLPQVQDFPEERAPDSDAGSAWANESEEEVDMDTNENTNPGENWSASPSTQSEVAVSIYGSLDPVPNRRTIEDEVGVTITPEEDNMNIRRLEEYNFAERWRLNIEILDQAERERVHWHAEWMRTQANRGLAHSPGDFWYR